jgi:hypothetical protein
VAAEAMSCREFCRELKVACRLLKSDSWPCRSFTLFCNCTIGSEAIDTARCRTCWKELEKVLEPLNVMGAAAEVSAELAAELPTELVDEAIAKTLCKTRAEPPRVRPLLAYVSAAKVNP